MRRMLMLLTLLLVPAAALARDAMLIWTAPGDDGVVGRATAYEIRFKTVTIAGQDTLGWWANAGGVASVPAPSPAGQRDSVLVTGLDPTRDHYFLLVAVDERGNRSYYSNLAPLFAAPPPDTLRPAAVRSLTASPR